MDGCKCDSQFSCHIFTFEVTAKDFFVLIPCCTTCIAVQDMSKEVLRCCPVVFVHHRKSWQLNRTTQTCHCRQESVCEHWERWETAWRLMRTSSQGDTSAPGWRWNGWRRFTWRRAAWRMPTSCTPSLSREMLSQWQTPVTLQAYKVQRV